ncbi:MAG: GTPase ObgE [Candidatus Omnitrophota bacterium]
MFVDYVEIYVTAGNGGNGVVAFRREKSIPRGGPSGGDGGNGGSAIIRASASLHTLIDFRYQHHFQVRNGENGRGKNQTGACSEDKIILVPVGTVVRTKENEILADLAKVSDEILVAKGGKGGLGNARFATPVRQAPKFAKQGTPGETAHLILELKLIADVGLVGYPNSGKSTLLSVISNSRPKIAPYPFTTLEPSLGLVRVKEGSSFVAADIPGLIEGAHKGKGLGIRFLRHIERTRIILHLIDLSEPRPMERYRKIRAELNQYGAGLTEKPEIVVANKMDLPEAKETLPAFQEAMKKEGREVFVISALHREGLPALLYAAAGLL